eukprot:349677-Chlamydomonas_euryale.AAC.9
MEVRTSNKPSSVAHDGTCLITHDGAGVGALGGEGNKAEALAGMDRTAPGETVIMRRCPSGPRLYPRASGRGVHRWCATGLHSFRARRCHGRT